MGWWDVVRRAARDERIRGLSERSLTFCSVSVSLGDDEHDVMLRDLETAGVGMLF